MYNDQYQSNQQYQAYNSYQQPQSQQYYNPQAFDTQNDKINKYDDGYGGDFSDSYIRADFVKKVYILLTFELAITLGMIALGLYTGMQSWLINTDYGIIVFCGMAGRNSYCITTYEYDYLSPTWLFYVSFIIALILQIVLYCGGNISRRAPINYILVFLYLVFFGFMLSTFCIMLAFYGGTGIVWEAWGITFAIVFALTLYACKTKTDFSFKIGAIFILLPSMLMMVIMLCIWPSAALYICLCCLFIIFYGFYLIWETQLIMGKGKLKLSIDDYVIGSLILYGTIIQLFLRIIEILAIARGGR